MTVEARMLAQSVVLGIVQTIAASHAASLRRGYRWTASPRDVVVDPLRGVAGCLDRALRNLLETFPLFAGSCSWRTSRMRTAPSRSGARLYFWARVAYVPLYAAGVPNVRSLVRNVATVRDPAARRRFVSGMIPRTPRDAAGRGARFVGITGLRRGIESPATRSGVLSPEVACLEDPGPTLHKEGRTDR